MDSRNKQDSNSGGFFAGVIVGVLVTLLLTTKKGRKILHMITDEGIEKVNSIEDFLKTAADLPEDVDDYSPEEGQTDYVRQETAKPYTNGHYASAPDVTNGLKAHHGHSAGRRFFRGAPKN